MKPKKLPQKDDTTDRILAGIVFFGMGLCLGIAMTYYAPININEKHSFIFMGAALFVSALLEVLPFND